MTTETKKTEAWWICELATSSICSPFYWCGGNSWTQNFNDDGIKKYTSREEAHAASIDSPNAVRVCEHMWVDHGDHKND